ncbi:hypothetical protein FBU30_010775 [Linnemannia zychae]|nr:hypothetical protein FBU30_010775 [Linnemannia zychae]
MKFSLAIITLATSAFVVTAQSPTPFIKTLANASNFKNVPTPFRSYSRCELAVEDKRPSLKTVQKIVGPKFECYQRNDKNSTFCTVKPEVRGMETGFFATVTGQLCDQYNGYLQLTMSP